MSTSVVILILIAIVVFSAKRVAKQKSERSRCISTNSIDSLNPPADFSLEMQEEILKIADFCGVRYVTQADIQKFTVHEISEDFLAMPGWDIWDISVHETPEQYERMEHAAMSKRISVLSYDPQYRLAKVQGKTAIYLTSCKRCSCPDYRKRRLPCKHMYALAMELDRDVDKRIFDHKHPALYGLTLALADHPAKSHKDSEICAEITELGGMWSDGIGFNSSAVVMGADPSPAKASCAEEYDMEILSSEAIKHVFASKKNLEKANTPT